MSVWRVVWQFRLANRGWTETYYRDYPTPGSIELFSAATRNARMACSPSSVVLESISFIADQPATIGVFSSRVSRIFQVGQIGSFSYQAVTSQPDAPTIAAFCRLRTELGVGRGLWLRGLPDAAVTYSDNLVSNPELGLREKINTWISHLTRQPFTSMKRFIPAENSVPGWVTNLAVHTGNPAWTRVTITPFDPLWVVGSLVRITRMPGRAVPGLKGIFTVVGVEDESIVIGYRMPTTAASIVTFGVPQARRVVADYQALTNGEFVRFSSRDTGRPTGVPRGRGRAAIRRQ
jgi:hypothetical protein